MEDAADRVARIYDMQTNFNINRKDESFLII